MINKLFKYFYLNNIKMIIGIGGKKGSGKDTLAKYLINNNNFIRYAFGDPVKEVCRVLFDLSDEQLYGNKKDTFDEKLGVHPRELFQKIGTEFGRNYIHQLFPNLKIIKGDLWVDKFNNFFENNKSVNIVITDVRFDSEINSIKDKGGTLIYIKRPNENKDDNHLSEIITESKFDIIINNNSTKNELYNKYKSLNIN